MPKSKPIKVVGVIGDPIHHSLSPLMHNAALAKLKLPYIYQAFHVRPPELKKFVRSLNHSSIIGFNVTLPHKESIIPLLDQLTPTAKQMQAVNTVYKKGGKWIGDNTDGKGYLKSLEQQAKFKLKGKHVVLIGAGGSAQALAQSLVQQKIKNLIIVNRTLEKAVSLKKKLNKQSKTPVVVVSLESLNQIDWPLQNLLINTTSVGLRTAQSLPIPWKQCARNLVVSDIVYTPLLTPFLKMAQKYKLKTHPGWGMLLHQGALAFEIFTGKKAPVLTMEQALLEALKTV